MAKQSIEIAGKVRSALFLLSTLWEQGPAIARLVTEKLLTTQEEAKSLSTVWP